MVSSESGMSHYISLTVQDGLSPLYVASGNGHSEVVDVLVKAGADVHQATTKVCEEMLCLYSSENIQFMSALT